VLNLVGPTDQIIYGLGRNTVRAETGLQGYSFWSRNDSLTASVFYETGSAANAWGGRVKLSIPFGPVSGPVVR